LTHITHNKKEAISQLHMCMDDLTLYSEGSGYMNQAAATTLTWPPNTAGTHHLQYKLGSLAEHMVFKAELVGILLSIHILQNLVPHTTP